MSERTNAPIDVAVEPGTSIANVTGGWRTERPRYLWDRCNGCDRCVVFCPEGIVFKIDVKRYDFDQAYCKGCGICAEECPVDDIVMEREQR